MFREVRRSKQQLSREESIGILRRGSSGVLALLGDDEYPYAVPMSYVYQDGKIYFHCATTGHKLDAIARGGKCSFCVIDLDQVLPEEFTTCYRSVIAFGEIRVLTDGDEKRRAIEALSEKYAPGHPGREAQITGAWERMHLLELMVVHMTGKEGRVLAQQREECL